MPLQPAVRQLLWWDSSFRCRANGGDARWRRCHRKKGTVPKILQKSKDLPTVLAEDLTQDGGRSPYFSEAESFTASFFHPKIFGTHKVRRPQCLFEAGVEEGGGRQYSRGAHHYIVVVILLTSKFEFKPGRSFESQCHQSRGQFRQVILTVTMNSEFFCKIRYTEELNNEASTVTSIKLDLASPWRLM